MISDNPEVAERKQVVSCPSCDRTLTTPASYSGKIGCPDCGHAFVVEALVDEAEHIEDEDFQVVIHRPTQFRRSSSAEENALGEE